MSQKMEKRKLWIIIVAIIFVILIVVFAVFLYKKYHKEPVGPHDGSDTLTKVRVQAGREKEFAVKRKGCYITPTYVYNLEWTTSQKIKAGTQYDVSLEITPFQLDPIVLNYTTSTNRIVLNPLSFAVRNIKRYKLHGQVKFTDENGKPVIYNIYNIRGDFYLDFMIIDATSPYAPPNDCKALLAPEPVYEYSAAYQRVNSVSQTGFSCGILGLSTTSGRALSGDTCLLNTNCTIFGTGFAPYSNQMIIPKCNYFPTGRPDDPSSIPGIVNRYQLNNPNYVIIKPADYMTISSAFARQYDLSIKLQVQYDSASMSDVYIMPLNAFTIPPCT
jgi:flagellar basal body-associated protein FliL